jgi:hypothetical protein
MASIMFILGEVCGSVRKDNLRARDTGAAHDPTSRRISDAAVRGPNRCAAAATDSRPARVHLVGIIGLLDQPRIGARRNVKAPLGVACVANSAAERPVTVRSCTGYRCVAGTLGKTRASW